MVGLEVYGMYKVLFNIAFLLQFIHEPGIQSYNSQNIAKNPDKLPHHISHILGLKGILFVIYIVFVIASFMWSGYDQALMPLMIVIAINLFLSTLFLYLRTNIAGLGLYRIDSILSSIDKFFMLIILGVLTIVPVFRSQFEIIWLAYAQLASFLLACTIAMVILLRKTDKWRIQFSWSYTKSLLKKSAPYALILLTMSAYTRMDSIMLERILNDNGRESGIYEYGYRFLDALNMIGYLFAALLIPMYASNIQNKKIVSELVDSGFRLMVVVTFIGSATMIAFRSEIMQLANPSATAYYSDIMIYLMLSFVSLSIAYIFGSLLVANESIKKYNYLLIIGVLINFGLNYFLIPYEKALGAAKATLVTQFLMMIGQLFLVYKDVGIKISRRAFLIVLGFGLFCILVFGSVYAYSPLNWIINAVICICMSLSFALLIRLIDISAVLELIKKR